MSGQLQLAGDGGPARCSGCGALAAGPCARCDTPLCGDCCEIVQGGVKPYAVCRACNGRTGASLGARWRVVLGWIAAPILGLLALLVLLHWLAGCSSTTTAPPAGGGGTGGTGPLLDAALDAPDASAPLTCALAEDNRAYVGCEFWPTVTANSVWSIFDFTVVVANTSADDAHVRVTRGTTEVTTAVVPAGTLGKLYLPWVPALKGEDVDTCNRGPAPEVSVLAAGGAYRLTSDVPVAAYQFNPLEYRGRGGPPGKSWDACPGREVCPYDGIRHGCLSFSNDASLLLPTGALTGAYWVAGVGGHAAGTFLSITATVDGTRVEVRPGPQAALLPVDSPEAGAVPATFELDAGDVLQLNSVERDGLSGDLSGTLVLADQPVQVISGSSCTTNPPGAQSCDHVEESVLPAETLGRRYFVVPPSAATGGPVGQGVKLVGAADGTTLTFRGAVPSGAPATLRAGEVVDLGIVTEAFELEADQPVLVAQILQGGSVADPDAPPFSYQGDPSLAFAVTLDQYRDEYVFLAPNDYDVNYADVVFPSDATVTLDGLGLDRLVTPPEPLPSGYSVARFQLYDTLDGVHRLTASAPVGLHVVGYGIATSYHYAGGLDLRRIAEPPR